MDAKYKILFNHDLIKIIGQNLSIKSLICLKQTCKRLFKITKPLILYNELNFDTLLNGNRRSGPVPYMNIDQKIIYIKDKVNNNIIVTQWSGLYKTNQRKAFAIKFKDQKITEIKKWYPNGKPDRISGQSLSFRLNNLPPIKLPPYDIHNWNWDNAKYHHREKYTVKIKSNYLLENFFNDIWITRWNLEY